MAKSLKRAATGRQKRSEESTCVTSDADNISKDSAMDVSPQRKTEQAAAAPKKKIPRKRPLRPEDQRTLNILNEKFQSTNHGVLCQVDKCTKTMKSAKPSNLKRHLSNVHPKTFANLFPNEINKKKQAELEAFNAVQDAIELVTVNGYPFYMLDSTGMRGFIKARSNFIQSEGFSFSINRHDIVNRVAEESNLVKRRISEELKGRTVSIMFDVCTIATLSMVGVDVMFMNDGKVNCRSLGIITITERHKAVQLANILFDILAEFGISLENVFSITSDTAKNATATANVLNLVAESCNNTEDDIAESSIFDVGEEDIDFGIDLENEAALQKVLDNVAAHTQLVKEMAESVASKNTSLVLVNQINCGTHVLQLSTNGALDESNSLDAIAKVHDICVLMRTQIVMIELRKLSCKVILPPLDNATRWNSKYIMVSIFELIFSLLWIYN